MRILLTWFFMAAIATLFSGLIYVPIQQSIRLGANNPQIGIAEDLAATLAGGADPTVAAGSKKVDIAHSLETFIIIFDASGNPLNSSAELNGQTPVPPVGVLERAKLSGKNSITWQPKPGVRSAIVVRYFRGINEGYVLVGRSLAQVEQEIRDVGTKIIASWLVMLMVSLVALLTLDHLRNRSFLHI